VVAHAHDGVLAQQVAGAHGLATAPMLMDDLMARAMERGAGSQHHR
jgi:hypothetical protein